MDDGLRFPQLIAFDLDYTLWDFWIDTHIEPPLKRDTLSGAVYDSAHEPTTVEFYKDVPEILRELKVMPGVAVAAASRTSATKLAREALRLIKIPVSLSSPVGKDTTNVPGSDHSREALSAIDFFDHLEIYPGSKIAHFKQFHKITGIPYSEMLFFDDESRNREVDKQLGVTFVLVKNGLNWDCFRKGLQEWRKRRAVDDNSSS